MTSGVVNYSGRSFFIQLVFLACFLLLLSRLIYIQVFQDDFIKKQLDSRIALESHILSKRGKILDRNDRLLAVDVTGYTVIADLRLFNPSSNQIKVLGSIFPITEEKIQRILKRKGHVEIVRHVSEEKKIEIESLNIQGLFFKQNLQRSYPQREVSSHVVGITDIDRKGIQGSELVFNKILKGKDGEFIGFKSPIGAIGGKRKSPTQGVDLKLTIDVRL